MSLRNLLVLKLVYDVCYLSLRNLLVLKLVYDVCYLSLRDLLVLKLVYDVCYMSLHNLLVLKLVYDVCYLSVLCWGNPVCTCTTLKVLRSNDSRTLLQKSVVFQACPFLT